VGLRGKKAKQLYHLEVSTKELKKVYGKAGGKKRGRKLKEFKRRGGIWKNPSRKRQDEKIQRRWRTLFGNGKKKS